MNVRTAVGNLGFTILVMCATVMTAAVVRRELMPARSSARSEPAVDRRIDGWVNVAASGRLIGPAKAAVTIVEFGDFECPVCRHFALTALKGVRAKYGDRVALVFRHWPLDYHRFAYPAARAAECAGAQGRFAEFHDLLYLHQDSLGLKPFHDFALDARVDNIDAFDQCAKNSAPVPAIDRDIAAAKSLGARGTPTIIVDGLQLGIPGDSASFDRTVRAALSKISR